MVIGSFLIMGFAYHGWAEVQQFLGMAVDPQKVPVGMGFLLATVMQLLLVDQNEQQLIFIRAQFLFRTSPSSPLPRCASFCQPWRVQCSQLCCEHWQNLFDFIPVSPVAARNCFGFSFTVTGQISNIESHEFRTQRFVPCLSFLKRAGRQYFSHG